MTDHLWLAKPPQGPARRLALSSAVMESWIIWKFAENIDGAKQFLVDSIGNFRDRFLAGGFFRLPTFPGMVPDLAQLVAHDTRAAPPNKYQLLADAADRSTHLGYPGYTNAAIVEIYNAGLIPTMFAQAATGKLTPEEALDQADREVRHIYDKWRERGKV